MSLHVTDTASNRRDQIANFSELLAKSPAKRAVFEEIYRGKKKTKTVKEIAQRTPYSAKRVTELCKPLATEGLFLQERERVNGKSFTVYRKIDFVAANRRQILGLAANKRKLDRFHTKTNPRGSAKAGYTITLRSPTRPKTKFITIDEVDQFAKAKKIKPSNQALNPPRLSELATKRGIVKLLGLAKVPKDWGGESNDIFTTSLKIKGRRRRAAFALKGPAKKGPLVPSMMGKNGDQIQRLFDSPAEVFFVQYEGEIKESVIKEMEAFARIKSALSSEVLYGTIDEGDTRRLRLAYPVQFKP